jgi:hypothetical protein
LARRIRSFIIMRLSIQWRDYVWSVRRTTADGVAWQALATTGEASPAARSSQVAGEPDASG